MTRIRVDLRVPVGRALPDLAAFIVRCEQAGFDGVGIHDHPSSGRDAYLALALACRATQRLRLFPATSSPLVRHPLVSLRLPTAWRRSHRGAPASRWRPALFQRGV
jgi:5,10-methylenetetrahydromethanopterin reductase